MGVKFSKFIPTNMALGINGMSCLVVVGKKGYMDSNLAESVFKLPRTMELIFPLLAQFDLAAVLAAVGCEYEHIERHRNEIHS
jgi:hypothetical protein